MVNSFVSWQVESRRAARRWIACGTFAAVALVAVALFACETRAQVAGTGVPGLEADLVRAELVSDAEALAPGQRFRLAVRLVPAEGWHLNWLNPGDAGLAPGVHWELPEGFVAGPPAWPYPERFRTGPLVIFGYAEELLLVVDVRTPATITPGSSLEFRADVSWLACADACIPGSATIALTLPVRAAPAGNATWLPRIDAALAKSPKPSLEWSVAATADSQGMITLDVSTGREDARLEDVFFYPYQPGLIENAAPQRLSVLASPHGRAAYQLTVEISRMAAGLPSRLSGILVSRSGWSGGDGAQAIEIDVPLGRP